MLETHPLPLKCLYFIFQVGPFDKSAPGEGMCRQEGNERNKGKVVDLLLSPLIDVVVLHYSNRARLSFKNIGN